MLESATGSAEYADHHPGDPRNVRIVVSVAIGHKNLETRAILDTAAPWNVLDPDLAREAGIAIPSDGFVTLMIRGEHWSGPVVREPLVFLADDGDDLVVQGSFFLPVVGPRPWSHPNFVGYTGALERVRFAVHPGEHRFWFGPL